MAKKVRRSLSERKKLFELAFLAEEALKEAVRELILDHKRQGNPIAVWKNGKVVQIPAKELKG